MTQLTPAQLEAFQATARLLFTEATELIQAIPDALQRAALGRDELIAILRARASTTPEPELRTLLDETSQEHAELYNAVLDAAHNLGEMPARMNTAHDRSAAATRASVADGIVKAADLLPDAKASKAFDRPIKEFAIGTTGLTVGQLIDDYIAITEGALGHAAGSSKIASRIRSVAEAAVKDAVGLLPLPPTETLNAVFRELTESQLERDIDALRAETGDRLYRLRRLQAKFRDQLDFSQKINDASTSAAIEAAANEARVLTLSKFVQA